MRIGLLHPGAMGVTVGKALRDSGHAVLWLPAGRSEATRSRAVAAGFEACDSLEELAQAADGVISVCPPAAAESLADEVMHAGFSGTFIDANAVAPETARRLHRRVGDGFVDGGIIGPPATNPGTTRLYLAGEDAPAVKDWFSDGNLTVALVAGAAGSASALKMCYAAYTKGVSALLLGIRALAEAEGVTGSLLSEWAISQPTLEARSESAALGSSPKAWRFVGEMEEIASSFAAQGLPDGFHLAAAEVYRRLEPFKDARNVSLEEVIAALR